MPKSANERGIKSPFKLRVGIDVDTFRGLNLENDPGAIADSEFQDLINARIRSGGEIGSRGGQDKMFGEAFDGPIVGIFDDEITESPVMIYGGAGNVSTWDTAQTPNVQAVGTTGKTSFIVGVFQGAVWFGNLAQNNVDVDFYSIVATPGGGTPVPVFRFTAFGGGIGASPIDGEAVVVGGKMYMTGRVITVIPPAPYHSPVVYSYDGAALNLELDTSGEIDALGSYFGPFDGFNRGRLLSIHQDVYAIIPYANVANGYYVDISLRKRSALGVWSTVTRWTSGSVAAGGLFDSPGHMTEFRGKIYFASTSTGPFGLVDNLRIRAVDPSTAVGTSADFVLKRTVLSSTPGNLCNIDNMVNFGGYLYYIYFDHPNTQTYGSSANKRWLGRFDGTTWDDKYADLTDLLAPVWNYPSYFIPAGNTLYMIVLGKLFQSNGFDTKSWTNIATLPIASGVQGVRL